MLAKGSVSASIDQSTITIDQAQRSEFEGQPDPTSHPVGPVCQMGSGQTVGRFLMLVGPNDQLVGPFQLDERGCVGRVYPYASEEQLQAMRQGGQRQLTMIVLVKHTKDGTRQDHLYAG